MFWWQQRSQLFAGRRLRRIWTGCVLLSLLLTLASNPNRSLSFLVPDSIDPWVHLPFEQQWRHGTAARRALAVIPADATVAANTPLVPLLAERQVLLRIPAWRQWQRGDAETQAVDWLAIDTTLPRLRAAAFASDRRQEQRLQLLLEQAEANGYSVQAEADGVVVLRRNS